jgi:hypothetical protein
MGTQVNGGEIPIIRGPYPEFTWTAVNCQAGTDRLLDRCFHRVRGADCRLFH